MNQINVQYYKTKIGELIQGSYSGKLCLLDFRYRRMRTTVDNRLKKGLNAEFVEQNDDVLSQTRIQLDEYINGDRTCFDIPTLMVGTEFQKDVWVALMQVPYGKTNTYLDLAKTINNEKSVRAVASANGANSIALIIPCHRIIGSDGELVGYGGGIQVKKRLLKLEQNNQPQGDDWKYNFIGCRSVKYDGLFFTAVKTTGVFCKPSCRARKPNRENVIFYDTKEVAIKNRFRACKICKP
ncbi:methylated-DNA--[protein]-cysteine S-methyltransferase [Mariniblastus sp.]|nr:methylated-DNA--[protein]-cysteine S-methyltransferase [Mariniblastus sp.]